MIKSNRGQLSIFMGITLILVMGMLAFIVNVGLFVKAKINLQNAVDAAAFSGAATQARQLTNIAYVNWEMRNTYKEWMFKYYILGQLGLVKDGNNLSDSVLNSRDKVSFLLETPAVAGTQASVGFDKFNVPSICIHNTTTTDICPIYTLPGIPRYPAINVAGISNIHEAFVNKLVQEKSTNCSARTQINFLASLLWAYSSGTNPIPGAPLIAANRAGAWPEALELAMRMRNLEMIVNRPPVEEVTFGNINSLAGVGQDIGLNERPVKAFMSAFRNLGGGKYKDALASGGGSAYDELAATFKLTEIAPQPYQASSYPLSSFLIPSNFVFPGEAGISALQKHYLDLQAVPINVATMFTTFASTINETNDGVASEAACTVSKTAMPVPGYIMGFVKNPNVLTYYAVKGEAEFTGLFFPRISDSQPASFKLTAYAAAKPFGGKIGPRLFGFSNQDKTIVPRADVDSKSSSYISGLDVGIVTTFEPGLPIPQNQDFWANPITSILGGVPEANANVVTAYGLPNLIYDFENDSHLTAQSSGGVSNLQVIRPQISATTSTSEQKGLYHSYQLLKLKNALGANFTGTNMTADDLMRALVTSRQVTNYDAANYLIPDFNRTGSSDKPNAAPTVKMEEAVPGGKGFYYKLFAPLVGSGLLYTTNNQVGSLVSEYMSQNSKAIEAYLQALLDVGKKIYALPSGVGNSANLNIEAAQTIHANAGISDSLFPPELSGADEASCNKKDMASKFYHFFTKSTVQCGMVPLEALMIDYIDKKNQGDGRLYYRTSYFNPLPRNNIMTAYYPGPRQGTAPGVEGMTINPVQASGTEEYSTRRNFYSTKFIPLSKVFSNSADYKLDVFRESTLSPADLTNLLFANPIVPGGSNGLDKPYFLDF